jgi:hypothetical protein
MGDVDVHSAVAKSQRDTHTDAQGPWDQRRHGTTDVHSTRVRRRTSDGASQVDWARKTMNADQCWK